MNIKDNRIISEKNVFRRIAALLTTLLLVITVIPDGFSVSITAVAEAAETAVTGADFNTDSSMFHVNEAYDGKGILTVENGQMTIHVSMPSKNIVNLYLGSAEDAQKDGAELIQPVTDTVTYSDGTIEEVNGFDVPVPAIDEEFDLALIGKKGVWYDHKVSVSNPVAVEETDSK